MIRPLLLCSLFILSAPAFAQDHAPEKPSSAADIEVMNTEGFLAAHPDLRWRREGLQSYNQGNTGEALTFFKRASRYADKPSQAMVAEMLWTGTGTPMDRPLAYAWMDVAAERAYLPFLAKREEYWARLSEAERAMALEVGAGVYDEYGDAVAKERLERLLRRAQRNVTGSRVGNVGNLRIIVPGPGGNSITIDGSRYYDEQYWEPERYWAWQDGIWKDPPTGRVTINPIEVVRDGDGPPGSDE